jgi:D-arabinose 1-dehydrogenase-like Zn-dependent alcohol dehydrogenase
MGSESVLVASGLVIDQVDRGSGAFSNGAETVYVLVPADDVGSFLSALAEEGEVAVVGMPGRGSS